MMKKILLILVLGVIGSFGYGQNDRAIRDTGGGGEGDGSVVTHVRLTFGDEYSLPIGVLDTSDLVTIYAGSQTGNPTIITLPELGTGGEYDGKKVEIRGQGAGEGGADEFIVTHAVNGSDILVLHCGTGAQTGNDTIVSTLGDLYSYYISNGRFYRYCEEDVIHQVADVESVLRSDGQPGDIFVNTAGDSLAFITHSFPFVLKVGLGGGGGGSLLSYVEMSGSSVNFSINTTTTRNFTSGSFSLGDESGADWAHDFTPDELDYSGQDNTWFLINYVATGTIGSGTFKDITMALELNNSEVAGSKSVQLVSASNDEGVTFAGTSLVRLNSGDSINLSIYCSTTTAEFDCENMSLTAIALPGQ